MRSMAQTLCPHEGNEMKNTILVTDDDHYFIELFKRVCKQYDKTLKGKEVTIEIIATDRQSIKIKDYDYREKPGRRIKEEPITLIMEAMQRKDDNLAEN